MTNADITATELAQWLGAAKHWRHQEQARQREGRWRAARSARYEAECAEAKARECAQHQAEAAVLRAQFPGIAAAYEQEAARP